MSMSAKDRGQAPWTTSPFDLVVSNPPYVPTPSGGDGVASIPRSAGPAWAWNAGLDGRMVLDPLCTSAAGLLADGGSLLMVHSALAGVEQVAESLAVERPACACRCLAVDSLRAGAIGAGRLAGAHRTDRAGLPHREIGSHPGGQVVTGRTRVQVIPNGPVLISGPVRIETPGGDVVESDRFMVAVCTCRRSKNYPMCDTSHRRCRPVRAHRRRCEQQDSAERSS